MNLDLLIQQMTDHANAVRSLAGTVSDEQAHWKPAPDSWSILEVVNHLYDEERLDFRARLDIILHHPNQPWSPIDPPGWVIERRYNEREPQGSLKNFLEERAARPARLRGLPGPDWQAAYQAPWGPITAGDMFAAWVAHDILHLRQLVELHYAYTVRSVQPYEVRYAGEW